MGVCIYRGKILPILFCSHSGELASLAIMALCMEKRSFLQKMKVNTRVDIEVFYLEESEEICSM